jgi:uncharacterized protein (DUF2336 family)
MTSEALSLISDLDAALAKASDSQHLAILQRVMDLFLNGLQNFSDDHIAIFDDVIIRLIEKAELPALIELSARLAPLCNAPVNVIARLAGNDDIAVSGPVLEKSNALTEQTLAGIAGTKSQKHLAAIAGRTRISATITDLLVGRGNSEIAHKVTDNQDARLSELGFVKLIGRAKNDKALAAAIATRTDMPPELESFLRLALVP